MGWRGQNAYDEEAETQRRTLPWRKRYNWFGLIIFALIIALAVGFVSKSRGEPSKLTDSQIIEKIIQDSRNAYYATGHPCACPYDHARNGSLCGARSAYSRPGGAEPKCFPKDVSKAEVDAYHRNHP